MKSTSLSVCSKGGEGKAKKQRVKALLYKNYKMKSSKKDYKPDSQISATVIEFKD